MRKLTVVLLLIITILLADRFRQELSSIVHAGGVDPVSALLNGDVNGDARLDMSDAVYLLIHLFNGGPDPVVCAGSEESGLPPTGQTTCYNTQGLVLPCNNAGHPGQDGFYQNGCSADGRFVDNGNGTVTDNCTKLMWQTTPVNRTWSSALQYCESLSLGGNDDWRLPNIFELITLIDFGKGSCNGNQPDAMHSVFGDGRYGTTWSSTTSVCRPEEAWYVWFHEGKVDHEVGKSHARGVRAVRSVQIRGN